MKKLSFSIFLFTLITFSFACTEPHLLIDPKSDYRKARKSLQFEVLGGSLKLEREHQGELQQLLSEAGVKGRSGLPMKEYCLVQPGDVYLVSVKEKATPTEAKGEINRYGYQPIDVCTLAALVIEYSSEARNIVALKEYESDTELCGRAYLNQEIDRSNDTPRPIRIFSRKFCTDQFTPNAIFAVRR